MAGLAVVSGTSLLAQAPPAPSAPAAESASAVPEVKLPEVVAEVNGEKITSEELQEALGQALAQAGRSLEDLPPEARASSYGMIAEEMVTQKAVNAQASKIEVTDKDVDAEMAKIAQQMGGEEALKKQVEAAGETMESARKQIKQSIQQERWVEAQTSDEDKAGEKEAKTFYDSNAEQFERPEMVRASHILIGIPTGADEKAIEEKKKVAEGAKARVMKGEDFAVVARELSEDPGSKENGGDLDFFAKDRMVPEFADAAFSLGKGEVSDPVKSQFGFHVIKVTDKKAAGTVPFDEAKPQIIEYLNNQKRREAVQKAVKSAREKAEVKIYLPKVEVPMPGAASAPAAAEAAESPAASTTPTSM